MNRRSKALSITTGILAVATSIGALTMHYRPHLDDPDITLKIKYDLIHLVSSPEMHQTPENPHQNKLYTLLINEEKEEFSEELEKEALYFSRQFNYDPDNSEKNERKTFQKQEDKTHTFGNTKNLITYLFHPYQFLEQKSEEGSFAEAFTLARTLKLDKTKTDKLYEKANIQTYRDSLGIIINPEFVPEKTSQLEKITHQYWLIQTHNDVLPLLEKQPEEIIRITGKTRKEILEMSIEKFQRTIKRFPELKERGYGRLKKDLESRL